MNPIWIILGIAILALLLFWFGWSWYWFIILGLCVFSLVSAFIEGWFLFATKGPPTKKGRQ